MVIRFVLTFTEYDLRVDDLTDEIRINRNNNRIFIIAIGIRKATVRRDYIHCFAYIVYKLILNSIFVDFDHKF